MEHNLQGLLGDIFLCKVSVRWCTFQYAKDELEVVGVTAHKFAFIETNECNNIVCSFIDVACSSGNSV